jgi:SAM-dependent methyltransferase
MLLYAITIFISAFLLFQVQPIIAKIILPWFGGAAAVWSACMLFFQFVLVLGYLYAHFLVRYLRPKVQVIVHVSLLGLTLAMLHVMPSQAWKPSGGEDPVWKILGLLAASVGLPYLVLSTTGPLMQAWYARSHNVAFPYRLFAVSNLGSLLALLTYPPFVEPYVATSHQALMWSISYGAFCLLCAGCAWQARGESPVQVQPEAASPEAQESNGAPAWSTYLYWGALTACSSALLLAVTNFMSQNVASVPFLWIMPLALYLLSFILTFESESWYRRNIYIAPLALALGGMCYGIAKFDGGTDLRYVIPTFAGALLACCMFCHGEAARTKPHSRYLTGFYLTLSIGGAIGGLFVGGLAPRIFKGFFELPVALVFCALLGLFAYWRLPKAIWAGWAALTVALAVVLFIQERDVVKDSRFMARNFYGVLRVTQTGDLKDPNVYRVLVNGTITHGLQLLAPDKRRWATTYYGSDSGVGLAINNTRRSAQRVGVIGLGAGTLAAYGRRGDYYRFYDINPLVPEVARREFTFLMDSPAKVDIAMGDARLSLEREPSEQFDVLAVDAFSSDSIPIHLLTLEAFRLYFRHLRPGGILAVHVSNSHLQLEPVVERLAAALHKSSIYVDTLDSAGQVYGASWVLLTDQPDLFSLPAFQRAGIPLMAKKGLRTWTDDYSNLFQILK